MEQNGKNGKSVSQKRRMWARLFVYMSVAHIILVYGFRNLLPRWLVVRANGMVVAVLTFVIVIALGRLILKNYVQPSLAYPGYPTKFRMVFHVWLCWGLGFAVFLGHMWTLVYVKPWIIGTGFATFGAATCLVWYFHLLLQYKVVPAMSLTNMYGSPLCQGYPEAMG